MTSAVYMVVAYVVVAYAVVAYAVVVYAGNDVSTGPGSSLPGTMTADGGSSSSLSSFWGLGPRSSSSRSP